ncbi:hypothetical protein C8J56DRAFT_918383 [Mycena floridula]|nr:hypothetical protein C8J56DRAFT_918383 [Mycena floridula]
MSQMELHRPPATGSSNPANSLSALWHYMTPALDHIVKSPTNDLTKAPAINLEFYSGIHSACYNYITASSETATAARKFAVADPSNPAPGPDLYSQLDKYFAEAAREILLGAPQDDSTLVHYLVPCFNRYSAGAQSVNRLLNYVNRHYMKHSVDVDMGWLSVNDVLQHVAKTMTAEDTREKLSARMQEKRVDELKKWGWQVGGSKELLAQAEASAEAASAPDRIVPLSSLAHRRFRIEVVEPLLAIPKIHGKKAKNKIPKPGAVSAPPGPKGRLARAVKVLLESEGGDEEERNKLALGCAKMLAVTGVRIDHPLRKRLQKFNGT